MSTRTAWLAWSLWALIVAIIALGFLLWPVSEVALVPLVLSTAVPFTTVGALVASRQPSNPIGWLFIAFGAAAAIRFSGSQYATYALLTHPGSLPAGDFIASLAIHLWHPALGFLIFSFLLFPYGRLLSRRWRIVAWVSAISCVIGFISGMLEYEFLYEYTWPENLSFVRPLFTGPVAEVAATVFWYSSTVILAMLFASGGSLVLRLRRSVGEERQQLKWVVYSVALVAFLLPPGILLIAIILPSLGDARIFFAVLFPLIPIAVAIAILRYRLYDIDRIINRTLVYGALTATLALIYFGGVASIQAIFGALTGQEEQPQLAIVVSTLVIAALFNPSRRRIQSFIDRSFYRGTYDAAKTLEAFSAKLRDETDLDALSDDLVEVVKETMQPAHVALWLRPDTVSTKEGETPGA
jgi:hypothetical protein